MPLPHVFKSRDELQKKLASQAVKDNFKNFFATGKDSILHLVETSVQGNTFRAFHHKPVGVTIRPSDLYRNLAPSILENAVDEWCQIASRKGMHYFVLKQAKQLQKQWLERTDNKVDIGIGRAAKLLNLSLKYLIRWDRITDRQSEKLISLLDVPLDSYTLRGIRLLCPELEIPFKASMSHVKDAAQYLAIQDAIDKLCAPDFCPIVYEFAAWNAAH